jgi:hypothetical protein
VNVQQDQPNHGFQHLLLDLCHISNVHRLQSGAAQHNVHNRVGQADVQLNGRARIDRHHVHGAKVREIRQTPQEFPVSELLHGDKVHFEGDTQMRAHRTAETPSQRLM